ncbi:uncharacterized protein SPPG_02225 [Spizellomyces punctatus DAOM BR117]|uniref:Uncharacterized protein n=1 Tax=Spizellomyces punctatus (strain DAOM BR117) TaxID=645134 RepID=A0A0L0HQR9_SPIPD|nr:uncharacterized protein SPPG_02225 [Spizellomyces punctatus DAOM BR117]KND03164.1 hypothetical protein SPPG_02225 [Spizellomyces punctatus DAOM BR117]|eukprot:XP_016611203.1 hypothetical protein SPPG_02225 [Spizellomyces punctatus DAOM BR117]
MDDCSPTDEQNYSGSPQPDIEGCSFETRENDMGSVDMSKQALQEPRIGEQVEQQYQPDNNVHEMGDHIEEISLNDSISPNFNGTARSLFPSRKLETHSDVEAIDIEQPFKCLSQETLDGRIVDNRDIVWKELAGHITELSELFDEYNALVTHLLNARERSFHDEVVELIDELKETEDTQEILRQKVAGFFNAIKTHFTTFFEG